MVNCSRTAARCGRESVLVDKTLEGLKYTFPSDSESDISAGCYKPSEAYVNWVSS